MIFPTTSFTRFPGFLIWPLGLFLALSLPAACTRMSKEGYSSPPDAIKNTAASQARDLKRSLALQQLTRGKPRTWTTPTSDATCS